MATSFSDLFVALSSFDPPRSSLADAPWEEYVEWSMAQGLAPLAAYNLEYRLGGAGAPEWAREQLLSIYQGSVNDNVMKLVQFKRTVDELDGRRVLILGGASFAEALYPHIAFRPLTDIELLTRPGDVDGFAQFLRGKGFNKTPRTEGERPAAWKALSDERTDLYLFASYLGPALLKDEEALFARALPMRVYGSSFHRPDLEDALLLYCLSLARHGFVVPMVSYVDLRELLTGARALSGPYSRAIEPALLLERAQAWRLERALYVALSIVERLFPDVASFVQPAKPPLRESSRRLLNRAVVEPAAHLGQMRTLRGSERLRRLLSGGAR